MVVEAKGLWKYALMIGIDEFVERPVTGFDRAGSLLGSEIVAGFVSRYQQFRCETLNRGFIKNCLVEAFGAAFQIVVRLLLVPRSQL
jgi:hypothetical protein